MQKQNFTRYVEICLFMSSTIKYTTRQDSYANDMNFRALLMIDYLRTIKLVIIIRYVLYVNDN